MPITRLLEIAVPQAIDEVRVWEQSIILLEENSVPFGIVVDGAMRLVSLDEPAAAPEKVRSVDPKYVKGSSYEEDQEIMILDFERLLYAY